MSIDVFYKLEEGKKITKDFLQKELSKEYDFIDIRVDENNVVTDFAVNPKKKENILYKEKGYEFHLQEDGRYWHPIHTRDTDEYNIEQMVIGDIYISLDLEEEFDD